MWGREGGGFEVLRPSGGGGGQRPLSLLPPRKEGYTISHLKERLGQAVAYIRPLQADLDMTPLSKDCQVKALKIKRQTFILIVEQLSSSPLHRELHKFYLLGIIEITEHAVTSLQIAHAQCNNCE